MKKILTTILLACAAFSSTFASKAITIPFQVTLQNGKTVTVQFHGDEDFSFYSTTEGELVIYENKTWRLATESEKAAMSKKHAAVAKRRNANEQISATRPFPHTGTPKALVIMVDFSNQKFTYTKDDIKKLLNGETYDDSNGYHSYSSAAQYFNDCSNGKFRPQFDVVGPYHLDKSYQVYGRGDDNMDLFIPDVCKAADADVNFADYDADNDGYVDLVYVLYAGYSANYGDDKNPDAIWPKSGMQNFGKFDGKTVYRYGVNNELAFYPEVWKDMKKDQATFKPYLTGIGVFLHEMSHTMGLPDFYPTVTWENTSLYDNQSMEEWDLMDGGENTYYGYYPTPYTAWEREWMGWTEKMETLDKAANVTLKSLNNGGKGMRVINDNDASGNEYYILENIDSNKKGWYKKMPGTGMLVTHINYNVNAFANFGKPNNTAGKPRITILPANGVIYSSYRSQASNPLYQMSYTDIDKNWAGNTYPGTSKVTKITDWKPFTGKMSKDITNITVNSDGSIFFEFMGGIAPVISFSKSEISTDGKSTVTNTLNIKNPRTDGKTTYTSSNTAVATVDSKGNVKGIADGTATITATYTYNNGANKLTATYKVTVKLPVPALAFEKSEITTDGKSTVSNPLKITNTWTDGKTTYTSSNTSIATVDANGNVKGINDGTVTITATYTYNNGKGKITATYKVTVALPVPVINISKTKLTTDGSSTVKNTITITNQRSDGKITYKSSNTTIATIDANGNITGKSNGTATITVTYTYNNGKTVSKTFTVVVEIPNANAIVEVQVDEKPSAIYTIDGKYVGSSKESLPKGTYIQNGKKFSITK